VGVMQDDGCGCGCGLIYFRRLSIGCCHGWVGYSSKTRIDETDGLEVLECYSPTDSLM